MKPKRVIGDDNIYSEVLKDMTWSFTRLSSYYDCPYAWKQRYIEGVHGEDNFFSQYGKFCHDLLESYMLGFENMYDLPVVYAQDFDSAVTLPAPKIKNGDLKQNYFDDGLGYFNCFDFDAEPYDLIGIEKEIRFNIGSYPFVGYIDLLLREKSSGKIIIADHKTSKYPLTDKGKVLTSLADKLLQYKRQMYLYSLAVKEEFGKYPDELWLNFLRYNKWVKMSFDEAELEEAIQWAEITLELIESEEDWEPKPDFYWCNHLCPVRNRCCDYKLR